MILAVIILFNPNIKRLNENITTLKREVDEVLLIDNHSKNIKEIENCILENQIKIIKNERNEGIAYALNQGLDYDKNKYKYILTLDQDSIVTCNMVKVLKKGFISEKVAIVSPSIFDLNLNQTTTRQYEKRYQEVKCTITSGSLCDISKVLSVGGFDNKLFIDYVDFDLCLKLNLSGFRVFLSKEAILKHEVGLAKNKTILGVKFIITNHTPFRYYYIFRNGIYINKKYNKFSYRKRLKENLKLVKKFIGIVVFEENKILKIKAILLGIRNSNLDKIVPEDQKWKL